MALVSATRSWLARDKRRTRRPNHTLGNTISTSTAMTWTISQGRIHTSMSKAPEPITALRKPMDSDEPTTVCTKVVSALSRDSTSPVWVVSKKEGLCCNTWA